MYQFQIIGNKESEVKITQYKTKKGTREGKKAKNKIAENNSNIQVSKLPRWKSDSQISYITLLKT